MLKLENKIANKHINSFFIEIIIVLLVFSIACVILVNVLSKSFLLNKKADDINISSVKASSFAEVFSANGDIEKSVGIVFGQEARKHAYNNKEKSILYFDKDWKISEDDFYYVVNLQQHNCEHSKGITYNVDVTIKSLSKEEVSISACKYTPDFGGVV